ncbi:MAG: hypothetical protein QOF60_190 [Actinomycetota bacterium]|nr:hypothetical protein [Actinomycetota bacterium]
MVPKFLLKQFAIDGHVMLLPRKGPQRRVPISSAAVKEHFYSFEDADGRRVPELEDYLDTEVDGLAAPAIKRIVAGTHDEADLASAGRFLAVQLVRSPRFRARERELAERLGPILAGMDNAKAWRRGDDSGEFDDEAARRAFDAGRAEPPPGYVLKLDRNSQIRMLIRSLERLVCEFKALKWAVATADQPAFITSDSPGVLFNPSLPPGTFAGFRVTPEAEFRLPLSPRHLLVGAVNHLGPASFAAPTQLVATTNQLIARECNEAVLLTPGVHPPGDPRPAPHPPFLAEPTITIGPGDDEAPTAISYPPIRDPRLRAIVDETHRS